MRNRGSILLIGPFPPPVHGFSVITSALFIKLTKRFNVWRVDASSSTKNALIRHFMQTIKCLLAIAKMVSFRARGHRLVSLGSNAGWGMLYTLSIILVARTLRCNTILHHHSYKYINAYSYLMAAICNFGGTRVQHVFLGHSMQASFFVLYPQHAAGHVLANAIFVPTQPTRVRRAGRITVGLISNLSREKGLYDFIACADRLRAEGIDADMVLAGPVSDPADAAAILQAEESGVLRMLGPLYGDAKTAFFAGLDLFLFPTRYRHEAQPTVIYEAFAAGVPVIAFNRGCIEDQVQDCLIALPQDADFPAEVAARCRYLGQLDAQGWQDLQIRTRQRHIDDTAAAERTLVALFGSEAI